MAEKISPARTLPAQGPLSLCRGHSIFPPLEPLLGFIQGRSFPPSVVVEVSVNHAGEW